MEHPPVDLVAVKQKQQATWSAGDYSAVGVTLRIVGEALAQALNLAPGERVLAVAAGNGNMTLAAARRFCDVSSTDYVGAWLKDGMARAHAAGLSVAFREADAEDLPFASGPFDVATSTFGVMFTADQERAAQDLIRVTKPGGRIGLANWTPDGFIGALFKTIGRHMPPPAGVRSPLEWGTEARIDAMFGDMARSITVTRKMVHFRYPSPVAWVEAFRTTYGPTLKAFQALGETGTALEADMMSLATERSLRSDVMVVPSEYLEVVIAR
ncbi:MAG: class I SAM-dependent methyltransferase [Pseudomonadota bacterium]